MTAIETESAVAAPSETLVEVEFKGARREFYLWTGEPLVRNVPVIVDIDRGEDFGRVRSTGEAAAHRKAGTAHGKAAPDKLLPVLRVANAEEVVRAEQLRDDEDNVRKRAIEKVRAQGLEMKVSDTEWQFDRKKLTIFFTAEKRVDFRQLVRQLEGMFGTRVQMWHIGVRDEARRLDGIGRCARQFCSASWLPELRPVKSSIAKDQRLSTLNPAQISGTCGRLMCCLRYEHEFYVQQRKRFPKEGKVLVTAAGEEKVVSNDIFREQVTLRVPSGDTRIVPLAQLNRELGGEISLATAEYAIPDSDDEMFEEMDVVTPPPNRQRPPAQQRPAVSSAPAERRPRRGPSVAPTARTPLLPPSPSAPVKMESPATPPSTESVNTTPEEKEEKEEKEGTTEGSRRRRRRGRRGGRRGRDGGAPGNSGPSSTPPTSGT
jgi:cell fate regulator YaaT (PSP1 superfamily)